MAEVDDTELAILRGAHKLLDQLHTSPKTRRQFQKAVKELHPSTITDEDRVNDAPEVQRLGKLEKTVTDFIDGFNTKAQDAEFTAAFGRLRDQGYTEEGVEKIKKLKARYFRCMDTKDWDGFQSVFAPDATMDTTQEAPNLDVVRRIPDPEAGAALFDKINPAKEMPASGFMPTSWNFGGMGADEPDTKLLFENEDLWAEKEAMKIIREG